MRWHTKPVRQIMFMIVIMGVVVAFQNGISTNVFNVYNTNQYLNLLKSRVPAVAQAIDQTGLVRVSAVSQACDDPLSTNCANTANSDQCFDMIIKTSLDKSLVKMGDVNSGYIFSPHMVLYSPAGTGGGSLTINYTSVDGKSNKLAGQPVWNSESTPIYDLALQSGTNNSQITVEEGRSIKASYKVRVSNCPFPNEYQITCNYQVINGLPVVSGINGGKCECTGKYCNTPETIIKPATSKKANLILNFAKCGKNDLCDKLQKNQQVMVSWEKDNLNTSAISRYNPAQGTNPIRFIIPIEVPSVEINKITKLSLFIDNVLYIVKQ